MTFLKLGVLTSDVRAVARSSQNDEIVGLGVRSQWCVCVCAVHTHTPLENSNSVAVQQKSIQASSPHNTEHPPAQTNASTSLTEL